MTTDTEKKNQRIGMGVSIGLHAVMLLLFFLIMAWREPDPPVPEYGIELNFGFQDVGTGDIQPEEPSSALEQETVEEQPIEELSEETSQDETVEDTENSEEDIKEVIDSQMEDSPDKIEPEIIPDKKPAIIPEVIPEKVTGEQAKVTSPVTPANEKKGELDNKATDTETMSQGDNANETGDMGTEQGSLDSRALYGTQGGGGGPMLELSGWLWDFEPNPKDTSTENGKIVFEIKIDDRGEIISVKTIEKTVSPGVEKIYRQEVESLTFSPLSSNTVPAPVSTGRITFLIKSK